MIVSVLFNVLLMILDFLKEMVVVKFWCKEKIVDNVVIIGIFCWVKWKNKIYKKIVKVFLIVCIFSWKWLNCIEIFFFGFFIIIFKFLFDS